MASKRLLPSEALELVMEDGSDDEVDLGYDDVDEILEDEMFDADEVEQLNLADLQVDSDHSAETESDADEQQQQQYEEESDSDNDIIPPTPPRPRSRSTSPQPASPDQEEEDVDHLIIDDEGSADWVENTDNYPLSPPFTGVSGFQIPLDPDAKPTDFFLLMITEDMIKKIKKETNRYAASSCRAALRRNPAPSPRSFFRKWKTVTIGELYQFFAIYLHMGLMHKPAINDYWSTNSVLASTFASRALKRDRFKMILGFFHLNNNTRYIPANNVGHDPIFKLRPLFDSLKANFQAVYIPGENICIDEAMCPWRGRVAFRVYIRNKPVKWGIKLYELCESESGYVFNLEVYCRYPDLSNAPSAVVKRLLDPLKGEGRSLYMDNYYMCPVLASELILENTNCIGTTRSNRVDFPRELRATNYRLGQMEYRRKGQVLCLHWKDKRDVYMITTKHLPVMREAVTRTERKQKPVCNIDYSKLMNGVDQSDQMIAYMPMHRKTIKWWKKFAFHLITKAVVQAHCLFNVGQGKKKMTLEAFMISLAHGLGDKSTTVVNQATGAAVFPVDDGARLRDRHFLEVIGVAPSGRSMQRGCHVCYYKMKARGADRTELKNRRKNTIYQCKTCLIALCPAPCMEIYHTKKNYST